MNDSSYGVLSIDNSKRLSMLTEQRQKYKSNHFRMIVCGDSGIGKSSLVHALSSIITEEQHKSIDPIEIFTQDDTCIVDTCGYGALLRAQVIFTNTKTYIEQQFIKTNSLFNEEQQDEDTIKYIINQSKDILTHVNTCLYLIMGRLKPVDIEYMRTIHNLVNIIPVIIQPDLSLRPEIRIEQRLNILETMETNAIKYSYLGYSNYDDLINACKEPSKNPYCPPFMLDCSTTTKYKRSFHGLLPLKQVLYQYQYQYLHYTTTEKFINWRSNNNTTSSTTIQHSSGSSSSSSNNINTIRVSQYISKRRHSLEREMLLQEKKLIKEFEISNKQRRTELVLKELSLLVKEDLISRNTSPPKPMTLDHSQYFWILLSISLSLFILYQNRNLII